MMPSFPISKYRFTLEAIDTITLPAYKGSAFHGGFGHALKQISPTWFKYFYQPKGESNSDWPKPFVILPPLDQQEKYAKGQQFHCELTLIGEATQHYAIAQAAIEYLGSVMGLGYDQGKYKVLHIANSEPNIQTNGKPISHIKLTFPTRLRLKDKNRLQRQAPTFQLLIKRLTGRIKTLQLAYAKEPNTLTNIDELIAKAKLIQIDNHTLHWDDWDRFSGRHKQWMKFGGLIGDITYTGELQPFIELLQLGEWLHIGGKSSFGLGKYKLSIKGEIT